jgi:hypothetical protein
VRKQFEFWWKEVNDSNARSVSAVEEGESEVIVLWSLGVEMRVVDDLGDRRSLSLRKCSSDFNR